MHRRVVDDDDEGRESALTLGLSLSLSLNFPNCWLDHSRAGHGRVNDRQLSWLIIHLYVFRSREVAGHGSQRPADSVARSLASSELEAILLWTGRVVGPRGYVCVCVCVYEHAVIEERSAMRFP